jgi:pyruvate dehydrogenase E1 component beta subunit
MADGKIQRWHVSEGQRVAAGDVIAEVATTGATLEIEAENEGCIERILVPAGTMGVKVNTPIAIFSDPRDASVKRDATGQASSLAAAEEGREPVAVSDAAGSRVDVVDALAMAGSAVVLNYREALRDALAEEMRRDPAVFVIGSDLAQNRGAQKVTQGLLDEFGAGRVVTAPPLDDAFINLAVGAALGGLRPVVEVSSWPKALEAAYSAIAVAAEVPYLTGGAVSLPLVIRGPNGWSLGHTGHETRCVAALLAQIPGLKVVAPATAATAKALLRAAIRDDGPVAVLEHELLYGGPGEAFSDDLAITIGAARVAREGSDVTIVALGREVATALEAAEWLASEAIAVEVIDLMSLRPLDVASIVASVRKTGRLLTLEEGWPTCGLGAEIVAAVTEAAFGALKAAPLRVAGAAVPMPYSEPLQAHALPSAKRVADAIWGALRGGRPPKWLSISQLA